MRSSMPWPTRAARAAPSGDRRPCVLVIADDQVLGGVLAPALEQAGYAVTTAPDGRAALRLLAERGRDPPTVILLHLRAPVVDGWAFAAAYRRLPVPHAPIVVVSGARDAAEHAARLYAQDVLSKPVDLDSLLERVERCVGLA